ncbi:hypothetical protein CRI94_00375 [Longibacter salinarum]|uniref:Fibronectin type-III domain-containing protein n=1 Tax=Longibacter salinarum TaxID=1850348 RepID=A0A2A8D1K1_9BACT|nr:hypothetical protein [Longibacter salinarum]PEN14786.1 hypothetical protein CRI94_00375 [Longibacter salinarum]
MSSTSDPSTSSAPNPSDSTDKDDASGAPADPTESSAGETARSDGQDESIRTRPSRPLIPDPIHPADGSVIDERSVTLEWEHVPQAESYELQIATDRRFETTIFDGRVGSRSRFTYSGLPPQEGVSLFWRVRAFRSDDGWTEYGTVGTFELADWHPDQPDIPEDDRVASRDSGKATSWRSRAAVVATIGSAIAVGLFVLYVDWGPETETTRQTTLPGDTIDMRPQQPIPNEDGETYRISIDEAMKQYVEQSGGTWQDDTSEARQNGPQTP